MANRYSSDDRNRLGRYRQEEQYQSDYPQEPGYGQMGDSWRDYGAQQNAWSSETRDDRYREARDYRPYTGSRFQSRERDRQRERDFNRDRGRDFGEQAERAIATGAGSQLAAAHGEWHDSSGFGFDRGYRGTSRSRGDGRGFFERASEEISSWFDSDGNERRDRGYRGHGPANYTRSDERIRDDVNDRLTEDYRVDARNITVSVASGEVTLDGTVTSRDQKRRAEDIVEDLSGVKHVQNNLRVSEGQTWDRNNSGDTML